MANGVVDMDAVVQSWAEEMFHLTTKTRSFPQNALDFQVQWKNVKISHKDPTFNKDIHEMLPTAQVLFKTFFTNKSNTPQAFSFKTERVSKSTCEIAIQKGVTMGFDVGIQLKLPYQVLAANAGFNRAVTITKEEGETIEEQQSWVGDCNVTVPPKHRATAELMVEEEQLRGSFTIDSVARGKVHVAVYDRRNNTFVSSIDGDLCEIFGRTPTEGVTVDRTRRCVNFQTKGRCNFRYAVQQHVQLSEEKLVL